jgi:tetratricopeptide (TPR) repeat protein
LARCYAVAEPAQALTTAERLKARFPKDADVLYVAAETEMKAFNDTTFTMFQNTPASYRVHELSAKIFEVQNRFTDAISEYKKAIELAPDAPDLHFLLGRAILLSGHSEENLKGAAEAFTAELKLSPEDSSCEYQLAQIASVQGAQASAEQHLQRALQISPDFVSAMVALANAYNHERQYNRAIPLLLHATKLQPRNEAAHYALLAAYRNSGNMEKARQEKSILDGLQKPPDGEFADFLKKLGEKP